jgi:hypothetical protein
LVQGYEAVLKRVHIMLDEGLVAQIDALAGTRGRNRYIAEALAERTRRDATRAAFEALKDDPDPLPAPPAAWDGMDAVEWVRQSRRPSERELRIEALLAARADAVRG